MMSSALVLSGGYFGRNLEHTNGCDHVLSPHSGLAALIMAVSVLKFRAK